ncbi:gamma-glutamyltransferase [Chelativorans sp. AA-79]|uniref:gamma-glutamyltransferase n=1 Tax=Chelativorans sp. AA-79 TaxID=3028735 RepID=UPI0023F78392|nr:gamma-glutamyltransferase [Chelativorans sp. AA-79]WEX09662.1 gamma-glutamyltransferase [Chelativorans sp. AA-79]
MTDPTSVPPFNCEKSPAIGAKGVAVTNHPLASAAAMEILALGGNAADATAAALFALTVVEPMMVGIFGGGCAVIRMADGREAVIDGLCTAPLGCKPDQYRPISNTWPTYMETEGRENRVGIRSIAVPGNLRAWCEMLGEFGKLTLSEVLAPAIRLAENGFIVTPYLENCIAEHVDDLSLDPAISAIFLPDGTPLKAGDRLIQSDYARTLRRISAEGPDLLYRGDLARVIHDFMQGGGGYVTADDLASYRTEWREPVRGTYRGVDLIGPPPPCSGGVHVIQMLNLMEGYDITGKGFGTPETVHLVLEALKIAAADRRATTADPAFVNVPIERLISKSYAEERRPEIRPDAASVHVSKVLLRESDNTTHVTMADSEGNVVSSTQTINSLFGARVVIPGTGIIPNNYMYLFDPHPGNALSLEAGKRITSGISAFIALRENRPYFAVGLPGAHRIPACVFQAIMNIVDHGMSLQQAVEAPRVFTQGQEAELEKGFAAETRAALAALGHDVQEVPHVGGGMGIIGFQENGLMEGAACWRADGTVMAIGGGLARPGVSFWPDPHGR